MNDAQLDSLAQDLADGDQILQIIVPAMLKAGISPGRIGAALEIASALFIYACDNNFADEHKREQIFGKQLNVRRTLCDMLAETPLSEGIFTETLKRMLKAIN